MLVNIITRYPPRPPAMLEQALFENANGFGSPLIGFANRNLRPDAFHNEQTFGNTVIAFAPEIVAPLKHVNVNQWGDHTIASFVPGTRYLEPALLQNAIRFGVQDVRLAARLIAPPSVMNANQFGLPAIEAAEKTFSYSNPLGSGDRSGLVVVTTSGGSVFDSPARLVNGNTTENIFWGFGAITFKFDLGAAKIIRQARWRQDTSTTHSGLFQWQGSGDDASYEDIGEAFNLGGAPVSVHNSLINNDTAYRYYRLVPTDGASVSGTPYLREVEFYIEGSIDDPPD